MNWFTITLLSVLGSSIANIFRRVAMKDDNSDAVASTIVFQFLGTIFIALIAFTHGFKMPPIQYYWLNFLVQGIFWGSASLCLFQASRYLEASETTILTTLASIVTIICAVLFLQDSFDIYRILGTILILTSVFVVSKGSKKMTFNKGVIYALIYSLLSGIAITNDAFMLRYADTFSYLVIGWFTPALFLMVVQPQSLRRISYFFDFNNFKRIFLLTFFYALGGLAFFIAMSRGGQVSQVSTISQSSIIVTILIAAIFLKETDHLYKKIICAVLVSIGVILLR